ncbi:MAG: hypothetical protein CVU51_02435 [Deltaproteobacteria bacterium HGW-Deltaproteobacteria-1]|jgi:hypothetical protein|nr:MAG: hypothetical protein CVU51_02435 [Deltaproteobacteria bacterium HGW-Deltaproteobacteria-1]
MNDYQLLKKTAPKMLDKITMEEKRELLAKSKWTLDSYWMMAVAMNSGWDIANQMNLQVAQRTSKVEMLRLVKLLNMEKIKDRNEFMILFEIAMQTLLPQEYFDYEFQFQSPDKGIGIMKRCYAHTKVKSINVDKDYQCGCFGIRAGWYEAMGVTVKETMIKCLKDGNSRCETVIENITFLS